MSESPAKGTILITGTNSGLGNAIVQLIISKPEFASYHGLYTVRGPASAPPLNAVLANSPSHAHDVLYLDLADLNHVRELAKTINSRVSAGEIPPIRALILNAGWQNFGSKTVFTKDGLEMSFVANYLGHWLLTLLLLGSMDKEGGRIVVISSETHDPFDKRNDQAGCYVGDKAQYKTRIHDPSSVDAIAHGTWSPDTEDSSWRNGSRHYGASKLLEVMMVLELQRRMNTDPVLKNVCIVGLDPGHMATGMARNAGWLIRVVAFKILFPILAWLNPKGLTRTPAYTGEQVLHASFAVDEVMGQFPRGLYLFDEKVFEPAEEAKDEGKREWVWEGSVRYAGLKERDTVLGKWS